MSERYYAGSAPLVPGQELLLDEEQSHHLLKVMRAEPGQKVRAFGQQGDALAELREKQGKRAVLVVQEMLTPIPPARVALRMVVPWIKGGKTELVSQKLTELGVAELIVYSAVHEVAKGAPEKLERLHRVALDACKQCERSDVPSIRFAEDLASAFTSTRLPRQQTILLHERERALTFSQVVRHALDGGATELAIASGPEGGFAPAELEACHSLAQFVGFGSRILRAETAPLAAAAAVLALSGDA
jgi:16S rRNA (uracil1498-N3)-methyltransferase